MQSNTDKPSADAAPIAVRASSVTGDLRLHEFQSRVFGNVRLLRVWLPPGYDDPENEDRHYPVFYLNDGQNLFEAQVAFAGVEWQVDETADRLIREQKIPALIVVGMDNAQSDRMKEYIPFRAWNPPVLRPRGQLYPDFLLREVMPFVEQRYRVAVGSENTGLGGSSLGASISLYTAIKQPGVIGHLLLESPSLFLAQRRILKFCRHFRRWPEKIYLAIGTRESGREDRDRRVVEDVRKLEQILRLFGFGDDRLRVRIDEGASHNEAEWAKRFPEALQFLFGPWSPPQCGRLSTE